MFQKELTFKQLGIALADVYEQMGYRNATPDEQTAAETQRLLDEVAVFLRPRFLYTVVSQLPAFQWGRIIDRQLQGSEAYALFVATSGTEYEAFQQRLLKEGDMVRVFVADALGSVIAEKTADRMEETLQQSIDKLGWHRTNRFSPGYCGWHVSQQQLLFPLFGVKEPCGIQLTDSSLMVPIKSVSGIIGLGRSVRYLPYTCGLCDFKNCYKRRKRA
jgi:hypothetical protein